MPASCRRNERGLQCLLHLPLEGRVEAMTDEPGGRIFFSNAGRSLEGEDEIRLISVGVDIGSSTSHLVFSRIVMERLDSRYVVSEREVFYNSDILLTPYTDTNTINADALAT